VDIRHPDDPTLDGVHDELRGLVDSVCAEEGLSVDFNNIWRAPTVNFHDECISKVRNAAQGLGYSHRDIVSGAGHDACHVTHIAPTGMIFIPCENGLSHNEAENTTPEQVAAGADVLLNAVAASAGS